MCPFFLLQAQNIRVNPLWYCIASGYSASFCFMIPVGTPGNLIVQSAAKVSTSKMVTFMVSSFCFSATSYLSRAYVVDTFLEITCINSRLFPMGEGRKYRTVYSYVCMYDEVTTYFP